MEAKEYLEKNYYGLKIDCPAFLNEIISFADDFAKEYNTKQLIIDGVSITKGQPCECGNKTLTHKHTNCIECTSCNRIKVLQD